MATPGNSRGYSQLFALFFTTRRHPRCCGVLPHPHPPFSLSEAPDTTYRPSVSCRSNFRDQRLAKSFQLSPSLVAMSSMRRLPRQSPDHKSPLPCHFPDHDLQSGPQARLVSFYLSNPLCARPSASPPLRLSTFPQSRSPQTPNPTFFSETLCPSLAHTPY
jgi:hypothetical protein